MQRRNLFDLVFGRKAKSDTNDSNLKQFALLNGFMSSFSLVKNKNDIDTYKSAIAAHQRQFAKIVPRAIRVDNATKVQNDGDVGLNFILNTRPNALMNTASFMEKIAFDYFYYNNVFIYVDRDIFANVTAFWILEPSEVEFLEDNNGNIYVRFQFRDGKRKTVPFYEIIHLSRNIDYSDFLGGDDNGINKILDVININYQGIEKAIKTNAVIRFLVELPTVLSDKERARKTEEFVKEFLDTENSGGVIVGDAGNKVTPLQPSQNGIAGTNLTKGLVDFDKKVYNYLGISEKIVNGTNTEDEMQAYFENIIEPFATKFQQEFTYKIFTSKQISFGNQIICDTAKLNYLSMTTKIKIVDEIKNLPLMRPNTIMRILGLETLGDEGEKTFANLNYTQSDKQNQYQLGNIATQSDTQNNQKGDNQQNDNTGNPTV